MSVELLKVICQVVAVERDVDGNVTGERVSDPVAVYDPEGFDEFIASVREQLANENAQNGGSPAPNRATRRRTKANG